MVCKRVLIGGGTGFIGAHLERLLHNSGFIVQIVTRKPKKSNHVSWEEIRSSGLPNKTCAVVNLAGQNILDIKHQWNHSFQQLVWDSRVGTTTLLRKAIEASKQKIDSFTIISGVGIYASDDAVHDESDQVEDFDFLSKMCIELERASKLPSHSCCRNIIIRSGIVLGREGGMVKQLYIPFKLGLGGIMGSGKQALPWIHVGDLTKLILFGIENDIISGVFNGVAPQHTTNAEFTKAFADALHRPAVIPMPEAVLKLMFQDRHKMITTGPIVKPQRAMSLGFEYTYPEIEGACTSLFDLPRDPVF